MQKTCLAIFYLTATTLIADCDSSHCLAETYQGNAPTAPQTCNGDWTITPVVFYWNIRQDGMEYAINNPTPVPVINPTTSEIEELNNLINTRYETPGSSWEFGFKLGIGYTSPCDGWDFHFNWISHHNRVSKEVETGNSQTNSLIALWSAFSPAQGIATYARDIESIWKIQLDLIDLEIGRSFWVSRRLSMRPHVGLRYGKIYQDFDLEHHGGSWSPRTMPQQDGFNNSVKIDNKFHGLGVRSGLDISWYLSCGFSLYSDFSASILSGRFNVDHSEDNRLVVSPHSSTKVLETESSFKASRAILDFNFGLEWSALFCDSQYIVKTRFGWEHHLFFHQNQMWRVNRAANTTAANGENIFDQRRGSLTTQGWTFSFAFGF